MQPFLNKTELDMCAVTWKMSLSPRPVLDLREALRPRVTATASWHKRDKDKEVKGITQFGEVAGITVFMIPCLHSALRSSFFLPVNLSEDTSRMDIGSC